MHKNLKVIYSISYKYLLNGCAGKISKGEQILCGLMILVAGIVNNKIDEYHEVNEIIFLMEKKLALANSVID